MNYQQQRRFSPIPAALAVLATVGTLAVAVVLPAEMGAPNAQPGVLAKASEAVGASLPLVNYRIDVVGVRESAAAEQVHVKEAARKAS